MRRIGELNAMSSALPNVNATVLDRLVDNLAAGKGIVLRTLAAAASVPGSEWMGTVTLYDGTTTIQLHGFTRDWSFESLAYELIIPPGWSILCQASQFTGSGTFLCEVTWDPIL